MKQLKIILLTFIYSVFSTGDTLQRFAVIENQVETNQDGK